MGRKKIAAEPDLPPQPAPPPPAPPAVMPWREYMAGAGTPMRVMRFEALVSEFSAGSAGSHFEEKDLPHFHATIGIHTRGWMIVRRLFGIMPAIPLPNTQADDLRTWSREELMESLSLGPKELREELDRLRGVWLGASQGSPESFRGRPTEIRPTEAHPTVVDELFQAEALVKKHGMAELLTRDEIPWMAERLQACGRIINNSQIGEMMRMTLLTELDLRRLQTRMAKTSREIEESRDADRRQLLETEYDWVFKKRTSLMNEYQKQIEQINEVFPFMKAAAGAMTMKGVFSDAVACHHEWSRTGSNALADGVFTVAEIEILMRQSVQVPEPQYRAGQVVYLNQARAHLFDPAWRGQFLPNTLKKLDAGFKAAAEEISKAEGETLTDLMSEDPVAGEYPAVKITGN